MAKNNPVDIFFTRIRAISNTSFQTFMLLILLIVGCVGISFFSPVFLSVTNIVNIFQQVSVLGIVTIGMALVMISGGIDLSVGSLISLSGCTAAVLAVNGYSDGSAIVIAILVSVIAGFCIGMIVAFTNTEPFIITLGMMSVLQGITLIITEGSNVPVMGRFEVLGRSKIGMFPLPIIFFVSIVVIMFVVLRYTKFGRKTYALGGNENAAYLSGIKVRLHKVIIYTLNGLIIGFASQVLLSRLGSAIPVMGSNFMLQSIAAAVIGTVALKGGKGSVWGCFIGVLLLGVISNSLNVLSISSFYQNIILGAMIICAVVLSNIGTKRK